jgi:hypothetical protein
MNSSLRAQSAVTGLLLAATLLCGCASGQWQDEIPAGLVASAAAQEPPRGDLNACTQSRGAKQAAGVLRSAAIGALFGGPAGLIEGAAKQLLDSDLDCAFQYLAGRALATPAPEERVPSTEERSVNARPVPVAHSTPVALFAAPGSLPSAGDTWTYRLTEPRRRAWPARRHSVTVESAIPGAIIERSSGTLHRNGSYFSAEGDLVLFSPYLMAFDSGLSGLRSEGIESLDALSCGGNWVCTTSARVAGRELVRVPAGEFEAIKVEVQQAWLSRNAWPGGARTLTVWYSPQTRRAVKFSSRGTAGAHIKTEFDLELEDYSAGVERPAELRKLTEAETSVFPKTWAIGCPGGNC